MASACATRASIGALSVPLRHTAEAELRSTTQGHATCCFPHTVVPQRAQVLRKSLGGAKVSCGLTQTVRRFRRMAPRMAPDEEKMTKRSPLDFPVEWDRPGPSRRPDVFPSFTPLRPPLPQPMPGDPIPEDEEDDDEKDQEPDPDKEPEQPEE